MKKCYPASRTGFSEKLDPPAEATNSSKNFEIQTQVYLLAKISLRLIAGWPRYF